MNNIGSKEDAAATSDVGAFSLIAIMKRLLAQRAGGARAGVSLNAVPVGIASVTIVAAGAFVSEATVQNTSATQNVFLSFGAATVNDVKLAPGAQLTLRFGPTNSLQAIASAAGGTVSVIGA